MHGSAPRTEAPAPAPAASASTAKATFFRAYTLPSCEPGNGLCHGGREHVEVELEGAGEAAEAIGSRLAWALSYTHDGPTAISGKLVTPAAGGVPTVAPDKPSAPRCSSGSARCRRCPREPRRSASAPASSSDRPTTAPMDGLDGRGQSAA